MQGASHRRAGRARDRDVKEFNTHLKLAERVWEEIRGLVPFRFEHLSVDRFDQTAKTTRIWGENRKGRATPLDRILVLTRAAPKRRRTAQSEAVTTG